MTLEQSHQKYPSLQNLLTLKEHIPQSVKTSSGNPVYLTENLDTTLAESQTTFFQNRKDPIST